MGGRGGEDMGGRGGEDMGGRGGGDMGGGGGGEDSTNSIGCSAHTQYMSTPLTTSLQSGKVGQSVPPCPAHLPRPPCDATVQLSA